MATWNSASYGGRYLQLYISETIDTINNTSTLHWTLSSIGGSDNYYSIADTTVTIAGTQVYYKAFTGWNAKVFPAAKGSVSGSIVIVHDVSGSKSINVGFSTRVYYNAAEEYGGNMPLTNIDRSAPTISISTSGITAYGVTVSATASTTCDVWDYSINGGSSWKNFSNSAATSASEAITGLSPNTSYTIKVRARKKSNQIYGTSGGSTIKTLGNAVLNSVSALTVDAASPSLSFNWTVYSTGFTYTLDIKHGSTVITTISIPAQSSTGTGNKSIALTAAQRSAILSAMASVKSFTGTFSLTTKSGSTTIGSVSSKTATIQTTSANSAPTFSNSEGFTYEDSKTTTVAITGNNQIMVQRYSTLAVTAYVATAKNGASITQYQATIDEAVISSNNTTLNCGTISKAGNLVLKVTAVDSRGYSVSVSKTITVAAYAKVDITEVTMRRANEVEAVTQVDLSATLSKILVSSVNKNAFRYLYYRYKKTSETNYNSFTAIPAESITITDTSVEYENNEFISLDPDYSYHIQFYLLDKLTSEVYTFTLPTGTPLVSKRRKKVGINNRSPEAAMDINGDLKLRANSGSYLLDAHEDSDGNQYFAVGKAAEKPNVNEFAKPIEAPSAEIVGRTTSKSVQVRGDATGGVLFPSPLDANRYWWFFNYIINDIDYSKMAFRTVNKIGDTSHYCDYTLKGLEPDETGYHAYAILTEKNTADYIVEKSTSGIWTYEKYNSGFARCYGAQSDTVSCTTAWGAVYINSGFNTYSNLPSGLFVGVSGESLTIDSVNASVTTVSMSTFHLTTEHTSAVQFIRGTSAANIPVTLYWEVRGRWK